MLGEKNNLKGLHKSRPDLTVTKKYYIGPPDNFGLPEGQILIPPLVQLNWLNLKISRVRSDQWIIQSLHFRQIPQNNLLLGIVVILGQFETQSWCPYLIYLCWWWWRWRWKWVKVDCKVGQTQTEDWHPDSSSFQPTSILQRKWKYNWKICQIGSNLLQFSESDSGRRRRFARLVLILSNLLMAVKVKVEEARLVLICFDPLTANLLRCIASE